MGNLWTVLTALLLVAATVFSTEAYAGPSREMYSLGGFTCVDTVGAACAGIEANGHVFSLINGNISYRRWNRDSSGDRRKAVGDEAILYVGFGLWDLIKLQAGFSTRENVIRLRSDYLLLPFAPAQKLYEKKKILFTFYVEKPLLLNKGFGSGKGVTAGIGVVYQLYGLSFMD